MASQQSSASSRIMANSFWYGLETILETVIFFGTSILIANHFGPTKLGAFNYINFFVQVVTRTSGSGLAGATRKYMAEFLAVDRPGIARAVYQLAYKYQLAGAIVMTLVGLIAIAFFGQHGYKLMASLLILSITPGVMSWVPAMANVAFEDLSKNTFSALAYILSYTTMIGLTLYFGWDLVGMAAAMLVGRTVEVVLRTAPLHKRLRAIPLEALNTEIKLRIRRFCIQAFGVQLISAIVWDRSEMVFLKHYSGLEQIGIYSVSAGLAGNLLLVPRTFGGATAVTLMVEAGKEEGKRVDNIIKNASRYMFLVTLPVHLGAAAIASLAVRTVYISKYIPAIPVLIIASILAIPRAFQEMPETLLRAADRQNQLINWYIVTGVINILLDWYLIGYRHGGAIGAAWGNGLAQMIGVALIWMQAQKYYTFKLPLQPFFRLGAAALVMAATAYAITRAIPNFAGLILAIAAGAAVYILLVKLLHALEASDRDRLAPIGNRFPGPIRRAYIAALAYLIPAQT